jgi:O-antigen ligase
MILFIIFYLFSYFIENSLYIRIFDNEENFSSGRFDSIQFWYTVFKDKGVLGFGYIINNTSLFVIESPHNEFLRFYFEGGLPGLVFIIIIFIYLIKCLSQIQKSHIDNQLKVLSILFFSVILGQSLLNNIFNDIYRLFLYMFFLVIIYEISLIKSSD